MSRQHNSSEPPPEAESYPPVAPSLSRLLLLGLPLAFCLGYVVAGLGAARSDDNISTTSAAITTATSEGLATLPSPQSAAVASPRRAGHIADRFRDADRDGDGVLSRSEARTLRGVWQKFELIDTNQDGRISRAELAQYRQQSRQRRRAPGQTSDARTSMSEQPAEQGRRR